MDTKNLPKLKHLTIVSGSGAFCSLCSNPALIRLNAGDNLCANHAREKARVLIDQVTASAKVST